MANHSTEHARLGNARKDTANAILDCWDNIDTRKVNRSMRYPGPSDSWRLFCGLLVHCVHYGGGSALAGLKKLIDGNMAELCPAGEISQVSK